LDLFSESLSCVTFDWSFPSTTRLVE
jgi:hypothetical protein